MAKRTEINYMMELNKGWRVDRMDKLDQINYHSKMRSNFIKWWDVKLEDKKEEENPEEAYDPDAAAEELLNEALGSESSMSEESVSGNGDTPQADLGYTPSPDQPMPSTDDLTAEAMEIYARLQAEAAADEAAKQAEIDAAKAMANNEFT